jgi:hypothetical protein
MNTAWLEVAVGVQMAEVETVEERVEEEMGVVQRGVCHIDTNSFQEGTFAAASEM